MSTMVLKLDILSIASVFENFFYPLRLQDTACPSVLFLCLLHNDIESMNHVLQLLSFSMHPFIIILI